MASRLFATLEGPQTALDLRLENPAVVSSLLQLPTNAMPWLGIAFLLFLSTLLVTVVIALLRADRRDIVDVLEAAANWLPWRPRRRNRR